MISGDEFRDPFKFDQKNAGFKVSEVTSSSVPGHFGSRDSDIQE